MKTEIRLTIVLSAAVAFMCLGLACGESDPGHDPSTRYTAESLASELIYRFEALGPEKQTPGKGVITVRARESDEKAATKSKAATKEAPAHTLDALIADIAGKASLVKGRSRADVLMTVGEIVAADARLKPTARETLRDALARVSN